MAGTPVGRRSDGHHSTQVDAGAVQGFGGPRRDESREAVAGAHRVDLRGPGRDDDLVGLDVEHPGRRPHDDQRTGVDRDDLLARTRIEDADRPTTALGLGGRHTSARATADDHDIDGDPLDPDLAGRHRRREVGPDRDGEWRKTARRMPGDLRPRSGGGLTGPDVGDAIDLGHAVPAVPGQTQRPTGRWRLARSQDGDRDGVAGLEGDRATVDDDPRWFAHWRIRTPLGSNVGSGWSRAGRRCPMISISNPWPPGPSGVASAAGT